MTMLQQQQQQKRIQEIEEFLDLTPPPLQSTVTHTHTLQAQQTQAQQKHENDMFLSLPSNLFADEEDVYKLQPPRTPTAMIVSPGNSRTNLSRMLKDDHANVVSTSVNAMTLWPSASAITSCSASDHQFFRVPQTGSGSGTGTSMMIASPPTPTLKLLPPPPPTTPARCNGSLFASFSTTRTSDVSMWEYTGSNTSNNNSGSAGFGVGFGIAASPRTTDAVMMAAEAATPVQQVQTADYQGWISSSSLPPIQRDNSNKLALIPIAPSLTYGATGTGSTALVNVTPAPTMNGTDSQFLLPPLPVPYQQHHHHQNSRQYYNDQCSHYHYNDNIPTVVTIPYYGTDDEDIVSLLNDDPDDDDDTVLPDCTYDVLANTGIFADED